MCKQNLEWKFLKDLKVKIFLKWYFYFYIFILENFMQIKRCRSFFLFFQNNENVLIYVDTKNI